MALIPSLLNTNEGGDHVPTQISLSSVTSLIQSAVGLLEKREDTSSYYYRGQRIQNLRIISISSSSTSLFACLIFFYTYMSMHPSRLKFRHVLIVILIIYDFLKALSIIVYPILTLNASAPMNEKTIDFLGFFTAMSIEGGDLAILAFAIHTCLTIFNPKRSGGLYHWRYIYYVSTVVIPLTLASLAFINGNSYVALDVWCYLPGRPVWMRAALSFIPRYIIMGIILIIYCTIYFYVQNQLRKMDNQRRTINPNGNKNKWWTKIRKYFEKKVLKEEEVEVTNETIRNNQQIIDNLDINIQLQEANSQRLKTRYKIISRQTKSIFLYPISYFLIWIVPTIGNALRLQYKNVYAISVILSWTNPSNGLVDTIVFMIREKPWLYTYNRMIRPQFGEVELIPTWRYWLRWLPMYGLPEELIDHYEKVNHLKEDKTVQEFDLQLDKFDGQDSGEFLSRHFNVKDIELYSVVNSDAYNNKSSSDETTNNTTFNNDKHNDEDSDADADDDGMDFLDFLKKGPQGAV